MRRPNVLGIKPAAVVFPLLLLLAAVAARWAWNQHNRVHVVRFVVPDDYHGYFWVVLDRQGGQVIFPRNHVATLEIPPDGVLRVKDDWFFKDWHKQKAVTASGERIPCRGLGFATGGGTRKGLEYHTFHVGTGWKPDTYDADDGHAAAGEELRRRMRQTATTAGDLN